MNRCTTQLCSNLSLTLHQYHLPDKLTEPLRLLRSAAFVLLVLPEPKFQNTHPTRQLEHAMAAQLCL